ncbi:type II toxin-antitoxin system RelE/ParE family toxin [Thiolapillus sp.]|uniref:type II toxin-antitoxin system RelE/ParE family toxin n=3 Tax=Thiolapillus sp. TaxID=2017437 RepID=UPI0025E72F84|nr:killer suppression protein [Thiolapillus sp.]
MDISFSSRHLEKQLNQERGMVKAFGPQRAKRLKIVLTALRAAPCLGVFAPPYSPPHRCHELTGNRKGKLSLDLDGPYRLLLSPAHNPLPERQEGGLDWHKVTAIKIHGVEDTHG